MMADDEPWSKKEFWYVVVDGVIDFWNEDAPIDAILVSSITDIENAVRSVTGLVSSGEPMRIWHRYYDGMGVKTQQAMHGLGVSMNEDLVALGIDGIRALDVRGNSLKRSRDWYVAARSIVVIHDDTLGDMTTRCKMRRMIENAY